MTKEYPKVCIERTRHGRVSVYFRDGDGPRFRLPEEIGSEEFLAAYQEAIALSKADFAEQPTADMLRRRRVDKVIVGALRSSRTRARQRSLPFDLDLDFLIRMAVEQDYRCALSNIPFFRRHAFESRVDPFTPSIDRITPRDGYVKGNVRLVVYAVNAMLLDWGEPMFTRIAHSYLRQKRTKVARSKPAPSSDCPHPKKDAL